jgi:putative tricarboxylic transport membrane protein
MRAADIVTASVIMALGGLILLDSLRMGSHWGTDGPQSGFVPFWLAALLLVSCAVNIAQAARSSSKEPFVSRERLAPVLKVLLPAVGMVVATVFLGVYVASAVYIGLYMRWVGRNSWAYSIALPLSISLFTFLVFERWFLVPLPKGPLEAWLGY